MSGPFIIIGAIEGEVDLFGEKMAESKKICFGEHTFLKGMLEGHEVVIARSGVGKVLSAMVTQRLIDMFKPKGLIFTGIAGSLRNQHSFGDIIAGVDSVQHDMDVTHFNFSRGQIPHTEYRFIDADKTLLKAALSSQSALSPVKKGRILTGDQFISNVSATVQDYLINDLSGDCVDMEGAAVALVCHVNKVPHLILRTISDRVGKKEKRNIREFLKTSAKSSYRLVLEILEKVDS